MVSYETLIQRSLKHSRYVHTCAKQLWSKDEWILTFQLCYCKNFHTCAVRLTEHLEWIYHVGEGRSRFRLCGFEVDAENWVLDPFLSESILLLLCLHSTTKHVWTHVMICVEANFSPASFHICQRPLHACVKIPQCWVTIWDENIQRCNNFYKINRKWEVSTVRPIRSALWSEPETYLTNSLWAHNPKILFVLVWRIRIRLGHYFLHAATTQLSWHVQNCGLIRSLGSKLIKTNFTKEFSQDLDHELINHLWNVAVDFLTHWSCWHQWLILT